MAAPLIEFDSVVSSFLEYLCSPEGQDNDFYKFFSSVSTALRTHISSLLRLLVFSALAQTPTGLDASHVEFSRVFSSICVVQRT